MSINNSNFINLIGRLGENPVSRTLPSGQMATEFSLATNNSYKDRDGNRIERTDWHRIKSYGKVAEILSRYLERGSKVAIIGTLRYNKWIDKFEQKRSSAEIVVESFQFMGSRQRPNENNLTGEASLTAEPLDPRTAARRAKQTVMADESAMPDAEEDLPF
ncbi:MAG: single-stranded DNA-binding protein [Bacteroidota bacterium]